MRLCLPLLVKKLNRLKLLSLMSYQNVETIEEKASLQWLESVSEIGHFWRDLGTVAPQLLGT